jgi:hypothetical protein
LDWYFGTIAGYGSSASRLRTRSHEELRRAVELLSKDLFGHFPDLRDYRHQIDEEHTPRLYERLKAFEEIRVILLDELKEISSGEQKRT